MISQRLQQVFARNESWTTKKLIKSTLDKAILYGLIPWAKWYGHQPSEGLGILMYHRVVPYDGKGSEPTWNVTPDRFEAQLSGLLEAGFTPISLATALQHQLEQTDFPARSFVVTFDDGYANNLKYALPVLQKYQIPATIFLATAYLNQNHALPNDDWDQAGIANPDSWRALTTSECDQLLDSGLIEFGSHTHTHDDFRNRPIDLVADIQQSLDVMKREFGIICPPFAFPFGTRKTGFASDELIEAARSTEVNCSLSTEHRMVQLDQSPFEWGRFPAYQKDSSQTLEVKLSGYYSLTKRNLRKLLKRN